MKSATAIAFECAPSRMLLMATVAVASIALAAVVWSGLPIAIKAMVCIALIAYESWELSRLNRLWIARAVWAKAGHWTLQDQAGTIQLATLIRAVVLGPLIVVTLRSASHGVTNLVLLPDNCAADTRRRLRVRLSRAEIMVV